MTDAELEGIAAQALNLAKLNLERGGFNFLFADYRHGQGLKRLSEVENLIVAKLGEDWLNHGASKDVGFGVLRKVTSFFPPELLPDALVFASVINDFKPTPKFNKLSRAARHRITSNYQAAHKAVRDGILAMEDAIHVMVQTPARFCAYSQPIHREARPRVLFGAQGEFEGRMKLFGCDPAETAQMLSWLEPAMPGGKP